MTVEREQEWIDRAREGSVDAFDELMKLHQDRLYRFLVVRGLPSADAEDVVQDTFLAAYRHLASYRSRWRFSTWLYTIARRQASRRKGSSPEPTVSVTEPQQPDQHATDLQLRDGLWGRARELLADDQYSALWLYYGEDFDVAEIARVTGRSRPWVKVNLHRARQKLAQALTDPTEGRLRDEPVRT